MTANIISSTSQHTTLEQAMATESINAPSTVPPLIVQEQTALDAFKKQIGKDESFTTSHVDKFLKTMRFIESQRASYSYRDVVILSQDFLAIGSHELLLELFHDYVDVQKRFNRLLELQGCDGLVYVRK